MQLSAIAESFLFLSHTLSRNGTSPSLRIVTGEGKLIYSPGFRSTIIHLLARDERQTAQIQARNVRLHLLSQTNAYRRAHILISTLSSRAKDPQAVIYTIDRSTLEILPASSTTYTSLQDISDDLPENQPRFILLSYPMTLASGRLSVPYVMLNYLPANTKQETRMLYAGAKELMRNTAEVNRIIEISEAEEVEEIEKRLQGED